jgi:transcriptional regulator with AAA-type ATPase domain/tetratricopeptide (TPR) repeat protein
VIESREVRPLGKTRSRSVDVLVVAATNSDLREAVRERRFREDLYHRLAVLVFSLPPLRERGEDVLELAEAFLARACADHAIPPKKLGDDARRAILGYPWPGNVRELANMMDRMALFAEGTVIAATDLALPAAPVAAEAGRPAPGASPSLRASVDSFTRSQLEEALRAVHGNVSAAADRLGVPRSTLRYQLERLGLAPDADGRSKRRAPSPPRPLAERILAPDGMLGGERKQLTVLFADFKGSMERLAGRDPEDTRKLFDPVLERMIEAVQRHGGIVNQVRNDGVMALFGAPLAQEDHAVRACYAALALHEAAGPDAQLRVGLHSGDVVLRPIGGEVRLDYAAVPETTHVAAQMEQSARPGSSFMTAETRRLAEGFVEVVPAGPADVYELRAPSAVRSRMAAAVTRGLTRFVGRDAETTQIRAAMTRAHDGRGQVVALVGEPGVGKSRLTWEVARSARAQGWLVLETGSVSASKAPPYVPLADLLRGYFDVAPRAEPARVREKVAEALLALDASLSSLSAPLLAILDVPVDDADWERRDARERRRRMLDGARQLMLAASQRAPVLVLVDDLQWIDSETQAFLDLLVESLPGARVLLLVNYRPEGGHAWGGKTYYTQVRVDALPAPSAAELLDTLVGREPTLDALKRLLVERTEGNPFFIEESVRTLAETGALVGERGRYLAGRGVTSIQVPARVESILAARIDRLPPDDKRLLQVAAAIGTDVTLALLRQIADREDDELRQRLAGLQSAEFLYEVRRYPEVEYTFKHALTHDVAYRSLPEAPRRELHARIAKALEDGPAATREAQPELLAYQFTEAGLPASAVEYWLRAARRAVRRSAYVEAARCGARGLEVVAILPETMDRDRQELGLRTALTAPLQALKGLASPDLEPMLRRARELADRVGTGDLRRYVIGMQWTYYNTLPNLPRALELAQELAALPATPGVNRRLFEHGLRAQTLRQMGRFEEALVEADAGEAAHDPRIPHPPGTILDFTMQCMADGAHSLWALGYPDRATHRLRQMLAHARTLDHPFSLAWAYMTAAARQLWLWRDDEAAGQENLDAGLSIAAEQGFPLLLSYGVIDRGWLLVRRGRIAEGIALLRQGLDQQRATGVGLTRVPHLGLLAEAYGCAGSPEQGLAVLDEAFELAERGGEHQVDSLLHGVRGDLLDALGTAGQQAEASMLRGLEIAQAQRAKAFELRVALSLARSWRGKGRARDARELVSGIYGWFTEGFDTPDLRDAKALLATSDQGDRRAG